MKKERIREFIIIFICGIVSLVVLAYYVRDRIHKEIDEGVYEEEVEICPTIEFTNGAKIKAFESTEDTVVFPLPLGFEMSKLTFEDGRKFSAEESGAFTEESLTEIMGRPCEILSGGNVPIAFVDMDADAVEIMADTKQQTFTGRYEIYDHEDKLYSGLVDDMGTRGHSSFDTVKPGYKFNITTPEDFFGMGKDNHYIFLPAYRDTCFLSYVVYHEIADAIEYDDTPEQTPIHLVINGQYLGLFILSERVEIEKERFDYDTSRNGKNGECSFLIELENREYKDETYPFYPYFMTYRDERYAIRYPRQATTEESDFVKSYLDRAEKCLWDGGTDEYGMTKWDYFDLDSNVNQYLIFQFGSELSLSASVYYSYDAAGDGSIHAIRPWDVEHSFGAKRIEISAEKQFDKYYMPFTFRRFVYDEEFQKEAAKAWFDRIVPVLNASVEADSKSYIPSNDEDEKIPGYVPGGLSGMNFYLAKYHDAMELDSRLYEFELGYEEKADVIRTYLTDRQKYLSDYYSEYVK